MRDLNERIVCYARPHNRGIIITTLIIFKSLSSTVCIRLAERAPRTKLLPENLLDPADRGMRCSAMFWPATVSIRERVSNLELITLRCLPFSLAYPSFTLSSIPLRLIGICFQSVRSSLQTERLGVRRMHSIIHHLLRAQTKAWNARECCGRILWITACNMN